MSHGRFFSTPRTEWLTGDGMPDRAMRLLEEFRYEDPDGTIWDAPEGYDVDGASIPQALWTVVGSPYTGEYRRASIVHDNACDAAGDDAGRRRAADRMFYHACRAGGCGIRRATVLYIGVRIGAWTPLVAAWQMAEAQAGEARLAPSAAEERMAADFRLVAEQVLGAGETDDPVEIERRTDEAMSQVTAQDLRLR